MFAGFFQKGGYDSGCEEVAYYKRLRLERGFVSDSPTSQMAYSLECAEFILASKREYAGDDKLPLVKIKFENYAFFVLRHAETYLQRMYGDIWQWPKDAGRQTHRE